MWVGQSENLYQENSTLVYTFSVPYDLKYYTVRKKLNLYHT